MAESITQTHDYGDFVVGFAHMQTDPQSRNEEPVMWFRRKRSGLNGRPAFVIPLSIAHDYAEDTAVIKKSALAAEVMGFFPDRNTVSRIASAIYSCLPELIRMPPPRLQDGSKRIEHAIERHGLSLKMDGREVLQ